MNEHPIETTCHADLRPSVAAMQRAAQRARELALRTGTAIVISRQVVVQILRRSVAGSAPPRAVLGPAGPCGGKA